MRTHSRSSRAPLVLLTLAAAVACEEPTAPPSPARADIAVPIPITPIPYPYPRLYLPAYPQIVGGDGHSCALRSDWTVLCWGYNYYGQLGRGGVIPGTSSNVPVEVTGGILFKQITAGANHTCGLDRDGRAYCWGGPAYGEIGDGSETPRPAPVAVLGGLTFKAITAGRRHTCALTTGGAAYCWGFQEFGQLGNGEMNYSSQDAPVPVAGGLTFKAISAGDDHTCALLSGSSGLVACWGRGGALGNGTMTASSTPVFVGGGHVFTTIDAGGSHACGVAEGSFGYCWGWNGSGEVGSLSTGTWILSPVRAGSPYDTFFSIDAGGSHSCGVRRFFEPSDTTRNVVCWGAGSYGQLGYGGTTAASPGLRVVTDSLGGVGFRSLGLGREHSCAINRSGVAYCWGRGDRGQQGTILPWTVNALPRPVSGGYDFSL